MLRLIGGFKCCQTDPTIFKLPISLSTNSFTCSLMHLPKLIIFMGLPWKYHASSPSSNNSDYNQEGKARDKICNPEFLEVTSFSDLLSITISELTGRFCQSTWLSMSKVLRINYHIIYREIFNSQYLEIWSSISVGSTPKDSTNHGSKTFGKKIP